MFRSRSAVKARRRARAPFKPSSVQNLEQRSSASSWAPGMAALPFAVGAAAAWGAQADAAEHGDAPEGSNRFPTDRPLVSAGGSAGLHASAERERGGEQPSAAGANGTDAAWYAPAPEPQPAWGGTFIASGARLGGNPLGAGEGSAALPLGGSLLAAPARLALPTASSGGQDAAGTGIGFAPVSAKTPQGLQAPGLQATPIPDEAASGLPADQEPASYPTPPTTSGLTGTQQEPGSTVESEGLGGPEAQLFDEDEDPRVSITVLNATTKEVGDSGEQGSPATFRLTRTGNTSRYFNAGMRFENGAPNTAEPTLYTIGTDYEFVPPFGIYPFDVSVEFLPGQTTADLQIVPLGDSLVEGDEVVTLELMDFPGAPEGYVTTGQTMVTITIIDDDSDRVEVEVEDSAPGTLFDVGNGVSYDLIQGGAAVTLGNGLIYSTGYASKPVFNVSYFPEGSGAVPGTIEAKIKVNGTQLAAAFFSTSGVPAGQSAGFSMQVDTSSLGAGVYSYSVEIRGHYSGTSIFQQTVNGYTHIVYAPPTPVGGWGFSNMKRLVVHSAGAYVANADGTTLGFRARSGVYTPTSGHFNSLTVDNVTDYGTIRDPYGNREVYDADGRLVQAIDRNNNTTTYTYIDANGDGHAWELRNSTDPFGRITTYSYSGGRLSTVTDFASRVTSYLYTGGGQLQYVVEPDPDGAGPLTSPTTTLTYDGNSRLSSISDPGYRLVTLIYDTAGRVEYVQTVTIINGVRFTSVKSRGSWTPGSPLGGPTNPAPVVSGGRIAVYSDAFDRLTTIHMDERGRVVREIDPLGSITDYKRDSNGQVYEMIRPDPDGVGPLTAPVTKYWYDGKGNLEHIMYPDGGQEDWFHDPDFSQVLAYINQVADGTEITIDPNNGNILTVRDDNGAVTSYTYSGRGQLESVTEPDPDGAGPQTTSIAYYAYDSRGRLATITYYPELTTRLFTYNSADDLITSTDELGRVTTYTYDLISRLTGITAPDPDGVGPLASPAISYKLRPDGFVDSETDALGRVTSYTYDLAGRLTAVTQPDPDGAGPATTATTTYAYDLKDRLTTFTDALGRATAYAFDEVGRLKSVTQPGTGSPRTTYAYDPLGRLTASVDPLGRVTSYAYDSVGRLTTATLPDAGSGSPVWVNNYNEAGQLIRQADPLGRVSTFSYFEGGRLQQAIGPDPDGAGPQGSPRTTYTYDKRGRMATSLDPLGRVTSYAYDHRGRLTTVTYPDPDGAGAQISPWTAYRYDAVGNVTAVREAVNSTRSRVTTFVYDNLDRLIEAKNPVYSDQAAATVGTQYAYDAMGNLTKVTDPLGRITSYAYDGWDRLTTVTLPNPGSGSPVIKYAYDAVSNLLATTDPNGQATSYAYDALNRLTTVTLPDPDGGGFQASPVVKYGYDLVGNLTKTEDPLGRITSYAYDALDRLTTVTQPNGGDGNPVTKYGYDLAGRLTRATDSLGRITSYAYDNLDRLTTLTMPAPAVGQPNPTASYEYDAAGNLTRATDANGYERRWSYDALDRLVTETLSHLAGQSATAPKVTLQYDSLSRRTALIDPMSNTTSWEYDARNLVTREVDPRNKPTTYSYDNAGQLTQKVDRNVRRTDYSYDALGRMTTETWYSDATPIRSIVQSYDKLDRLTGVTDPTATLAFAYDNLSRITTATTSGAGTGQPNVTLAYGYNAVGSRTSMADNLSTVGRTTYAYDALNRLGTITRAIGTATMTVELDYDLGNRLISAARKAGASGASVTTSYAYDNLNRLTTLTHQNGTTPPGTNLASYAYGYDAGGRLTKEVDHRGTATYTYDPQGQLTTIDRPGTAQDKTLTFDANGNRTMSGYATGTGNRLSSGEGFTYAYDDEGNLTSKTRTATGEVTSYTYDHRNRLTHVERRSSTSVVLAVADYTYDGLNRRIQVISDADGAGAGVATTTWTVYDGQNSYADFDASGTLQTRYLHGPGVDNLLSRTSSAGATDWYLTDRMGTVREIASAAGATTYTADYDAFGVLEATTGIGGDRWGFTGRETDAASGLQYNRARYYDPATSRWISQDPIGFAGGDPNLYRYVGNGSTNAVDPDGLFEVTPPGMVYWDGRQFFAPPPARSPGFFDDLLFGGAIVGLNISAYFIAGPGGAFVTGATSTVLAGEAFYWQREAESWESRGRSQTFHEADLGLRSDLSGRTDFYRIVYGLDPISGRLVSVEDRIKGAALTTIFTIAGGIATRTAPPRRPGPTLFMSSDSVSANAVPRNNLTVFERITREQNRDVPVATESGRRRSEIVWGRENGEWVADTVSSGAVERTSLPSANHGGQRTLDSFGPEAEAILAARRRPFKIFLMADDWIEPPDPGMRGTINPTKDRIWYAEHTLRQASIDLVTPFNQALSDSGGSPIRVVVLPDGKLHIKQGNNRVFAAGQQKLESIDVLLYSIESWEQFTEQTYNSLGTDNPRIGP